jgi:hypothetical protein
MADGNRIIIGRANTASNPGNETSLSRDENTAATVFVARNVNLGDGIHGEASGQDATGVRGTASGQDATGVRGTGGSYGVQGEGGFGVHGISNLNGVHGTGTGDIGDGVVGVGTGDFGYGVHGRGQLGVLGVGQGSGTTGVVGQGSGDFSIGVSGNGTGSGYGVDGSCDSGYGVRGTTTSGTGVVGLSFGSGSGVYGRAAPNSGKGGYFDGGITVVNGLKPFTIDHPLDPENRYLLHTCVESSEMKNVYDGVARLDKEGATWVDLPEWFEALNGDFRYQLTAIGGSAPNLHVTEEISENRFKIAGGEEGMKVCWQVTGSRKDRWATANPFEVEQEKSEEERGRYLEPSLYDAPEEQRVMRGRIAEVVEEEQRPPQPSGSNFARLEEERRRRMMQHPLRWLVEE